MTVPRFARSYRLLLVAAASAALLVGCGKKGDAQAVKDDARAADAPKPVATKFAKITTKALPQTVELSGTLAADETSEVATPVAGSVLKVNIDVGMRVKKGDVLVQLDPRDAALRAAQANATAEQARARLALGPSGKLDTTVVPEVKNAKEAMDLAVADAERTRVLFESGSTSQASWDAARSHAEQTKAMYESAVAGAKQSWATLSGAQAAAGLSSKQMGDAAIRAPFDGSIAEKRVAPGEYAAIGKIVCVVVRDNPLRLKVDVAESDIAKVEVGKKVRVSVAAFPDQTFDGEVKRIGAALKAQSRALPVEAEIPNADGRLRPGLFARAEIVIPGGDTKALLVPATAVGTTGTTSRIFVRAGDKVIERLVRTGRIDKTMIEVIGDVRDGDEVATENVDRLNDGAIVAP
jgi:RND family efflux transporter MFP subunit